MTKKTHNNEEMKTGYEERNLTGNWLLCQAPRHVARCSRVRGVPARRTKRVRAGGLGANRHTRDAARGQRVQHAK
jgi:hypothetical protein